MDIHSTHCKNFLNVFGETRVNIMVWGGRLRHFIEHIICDNLLLVTIKHQGFLGAFCDVAKVVITQKII
jgi:hypothetical protein